VKYIANPVEVDAFKITKVYPRADQSAGEYNLELEGGKMVQTLTGMTARMPDQAPRIGDYWVIQSDGYIYLNPKDVFERKYRPAELNALELGAEVRRTGQAGR
jgi:hypothetical protein